MSEKKVFLVILDGWGIGKDPSRSAISMAKTPFVDGLYESVPNAHLITYGEQVGLPEGQMGNSEVGHLNIGAGRIVFQELARINNEIASGDFYQNKNLLSLFEELKNSGNNLHLIGLVSDGGVHSHINHLRALCKASDQNGVGKTFIHAFTDGRDCDPRSGIHHINDVKAFIEELDSVHLASVIGRYYAMDRDNRWERIKKAYDLLVKGHAEIPTDNVSESILDLYKQEITDEFLPSILIEQEGTIKEGDAVLFFNYRTDRPRQLTSALSQKDYPEFEMSKLNISMATMTEYEESFSDINVLYKKDNLKNTLGEVLSRAGKSQVRIAETEKYPHVTFFFNGGREKAFDNEKRILIPSPKVATYDLAPEMGAIEITESIISEAEENRPDFICLNYANPDMVGHTGILSAAKVACETVDRELEKLVKKLSLEYDFIVIADHGNSDVLINEDGSPNTAHTTNPVPLFLISNSQEINIKSGKLGDLAPTILKLMGLAIPEEMDGEVLIH